VSLGAAVIVGVGPGLGSALARTFADARHPVALLARDVGKLATLLGQLGADGRTASAYAADAGNSASLRTALRAAVDDLGPPDLLVYNAAVLRSDTALDGDVDGWASALAVDVLGAKVAAETVRPQLRDGRGSLLFTGGGLALQPAAGSASLSVGKAALRAYVQTLHAELDGTDVHATTVTITGWIGGGEPRFAPEVLARAYLDLHRQPRAEWRPELIPD
jgi:NADP-dependent 3-hydroxy acid dehydrogenase YdfG